MKKSLVWVIVLALGLLWSGMANAAPADEAMALVKKGVAMVKEKGVDETLKVVGDPKGALVNGEFYLWAGPLDKITMVAHPFTPHLVGKDLGMFKDINGKLIFVEFAEVAKTKGSGWIDYMWPKPGEKTPSSKSSYVERVPGENLYFGCGIYK
jgi:signal transduction histidine kinase